MPPRLTMKRQQQLSLHFARCNQNVPNCRMWMEKQGKRDVWDQGGEAFSSWDCPRWTQAAPSLYKQPLTSTSLLCQSLLLFFKTVVHNPAPTDTQTLRRTYEGMDTFCFYSCLLTISFVPTNTHPHPPVPAISKVNTPLNAGLTHFHCGWLCFQFSHQLGHPTTLEEKMKTFVQKTNKVASQTCRRKMHFSKVPSVKGTKLCM